MVCVLILVWRIKYSSIASQIFLPGTPSAPPVLRGGQGEGAFIFLNVRLLGWRMAQGAGKLSEWLMLQLIRKQKTRLREICCSLLPRHMVNMGKCPTSPFV